MRSNVELNRVRLRLAKRNFLRVSGINASLLIKSMKLGLCGVGLCVSLFAFALAPVVDAYDDENDDTPAAVTHSTPVPEQQESTQTSRSTRNPVPSVTPSVPTNSVSFSLEQRVTILERQITNLNPLLIQIDDLQQQMQIFQGKLEAQQHAVKLLEDQIRHQYSALDKRLNQRNTPIAIGKSNVSPTYSPLSARSVVDLSHEKKEGPNDRKSMQPNAAPSAAAERAYQAAFQLLKTKQYNEAISAFEAFNKKFPNDLNGANADYFLGQLYLLQGQADSAIRFFKQFITRYSQDARVPDAMLQCGLAYFAKGDKAAATGLFEKLIQQYPDSKAAQAAEARLQQFKAMISTAAISTKNKA
ncbi:tol-pal system protein YbgF [Rickettsiella grylli]|uniref:Cell division coordinator CpoB n=1 Tax=Rickettsiella grylli TaxID=59196 RepID=A8PMC7_9COXI|nr:tol-pal system protein YbgF [Rickettsiella grylli]EDP46481.1 TPR repeat protein [Rickettsiella grylli]